MARELQDHYFKRAKREGYRSRAAFKLMEIDDKRHILKKRDAVLDCGAAPGSWLEVAAQRVGPRGVVVGVDLQPIEPFQQTDNVHTLVADINKLEPLDVQAFLPRRKDFFDVVLSDMAPSTTGDRNTDHHRSINLCQAVVNVLPSLLRPGGTTVMKVFEGSAYADFLTDCAAIFEKVKGFKPPASRAVSTEMYVIGTGFEPANVSDDHSMTLPPPKPSGWGTDG